jgi:hypothetical protein
MSEHDEQSFPSAHLEPLTPARRKLVHALVWLGLNNRKAAKHAGCSEAALYQALHTDTFQKALDIELKVRRKSARVGNIPALERVRDSSKNALAVVAAVKTLELIAGEGEDTSRGQQVPGYVFVIEKRGQQIADLAHQSHKPLIDLTPVGTSSDQRVSGGSDDDAG